MDVIFFIYGLSFIAMALVILVQPKEETPQEFARFVWLLVAFGLTHGLLEWMDLWTVVRGEDLALETWKVFFLFISFGFLFEFGRRLVLSSPVPVLVRNLLGKSVYGVVVLGFLLEFMLIPDWKLATIIASRYFLGFSGSTLSGIGFLLCFSKKVEQQGISPSLAWAKKYFILAAVAFLLYGVMGGLVVPAVDVFPANIINQQGFLATFQIPVQLFRAACAVLATIAIGNILRVFHEEARARLRSSLALADERSHQLAESEANLRDIASTIGEGLYVMDRNGLISYTNPEAHHLLGWDETELIGQDAHQLFHYKKANNEPHPSCDCNIRNVVSTGRSFRSEDEVFWRKNGLPINVRISASPIMREGVIVGSVTAFSDITERKQAEIALQASKDYAENLINTANAIFVELDIEGKVKRFNQAAEEITGYSLEEIKGCNWFEKITPRDRYPEVWEMFEHLSAGGLLRHFENPVLTKSGEERYIVWKNREVLTNGEITGLITFGIDITERKKAEETLAEQKEFLNTILDSQPECVKIVSREGELLQMNPAGLTMLEANCIEEVREAGLMEFILPEYRADFIKLSTRVFRGESGILAFPIKGLRGTQRWLETHATPLRDRKGEIIALVGLTRDITERKRTEEALRESEARFRDTLENTPIGMAIISLDGAFLQVNRALCKILGHEKDKLETLSVKEVTYSEDLKAVLANMQRMEDSDAKSFKQETRFLHKNGGIVWIQFSSSLMRDASGAPLYFITQIEDISERRSSQELIHHLAYYDILTNLPNRRLLLDRLNHAVTQAKRHRRPMALMFLDLDRFKQINDTLGHEAGDELLKVVAIRLLACVRSGDTVSRQGGDEFVIVLPEVTQPKDAALVAEKILKALQEPISVADHQLHITTSIGIATLPTDNSEDAKELMKKADMAMYAAKEAGRNNYRFCSCPSGYAGSKCLPEGEQNLQGLDTAEI